MTVHTAHNGRVNETPRSSAWKGWRTWRPGPGRRRDGQLVLLSALLVTIGIPSAELNAQAPPFRSYGGSSVSFDARVHAQYEATSTDSPSTFSMRRAWVTWMAATTTSSAAASSSTLSRPRYWTPGSR